MRTQLYRLLTAVCLIAIASWLTACGSSTEETLKPPTSYLKGQILLIMDTLHWSKGIGHVLRQQLSPPMAELPQPEPLFDLLRTPPSSFNSTLQRAASLLFVVLSESRGEEDKRLRRLFRDYLPSDTARLHFFRDLYARGQRVALLLAKDSSRAIDFLEKKGRVLRRYFERAERRHILQKISPITDETLYKGLMTRYGFGLRLPKTYELAKESKHFIWARYLDASVDKNIFVHHVPYTDSVVFSSPSSYREKITRKYLRDSEKSHLYITIQPEVPLTHERISFQGSYAVRSYGRWKLSDNSIGGVFVSYLLAASNGRLYYLEAFLYRPGKKKRDMIREMEALLWTFSLPEEDASSDN